jgi:hypothetical protein
MKDQLNHEQFKQLKCMHTSKLIVAGVAVFAFGLSANVGWGQNHQLVFTEKSSSDLSLTLDQSSLGSIVKVGPDHWTWETTLAGLEDTVAVDGVGVWVEPGGEPGYNHVFSITVENGLNQATMVWDILSDDTKFVLPPGVTPAGNGDLGLTISVFTASGALLFGPADVYFDDRGDPNVPDGGSSLGMLLVSAAGVFGGARCGRFGRADPWSKCQK